MRYTLRQLEIYAAIARTRSLTRAAAEVHLTQPAVSMQLKQLEEAVGVPLTEPAGRGIQLTDAGREFAEHVEEVLERVAHLEELAARWKGVRSGRVRLGVVSTAKYFVPKLLARFLKIHPGVDFRMTIHNREEILSELRANTVDFAIMGRPPEGIDCLAKPFAPNPLGIVAAPGHPLARRRRIAPAQLADEAFIVREPGSGTRGAMERFFAGHRVRWRTAMEMASNESIKQAVIAGLGLGFLSLQTVRSELATGRLVALDVEGLPIEREWFVVRRTSRRLVPAAEEFGEFLVREAPALLDSEGPLPATRRSATGTPGTRRARKRTG
ncbi:MAG TPA: LysR family transcriptional regulator [Usitatibacter sp.]|nr:LysR family transcriptional regulator [Usitatibacter sp.]